MPKISLFKALKHDRWVRLFLRQYRKTLILSLLLGILTYVCGAGLMFCAGYLISKAASRPENILLIYVPIVLTRAFGIGRPAVQYFERLVSHNWVFRMTSKLRQRLYDAFERQATLFKSKYQLGQVLGLLSDDISHLQNLYLRSLFPMFVGWGLYVLIVVLLGILSPLLGLWLFLLFGLMIIAIPLWSILVNGARQTYAKQVNDQLYVNLTDDVLGVSDWILSGRNQAYLQLHVQHARQLLHVRRQMEKFARLRDFCLQVFYLLIILSLILWTAARFGGRTTSATNWIAAFILAVFPLVSAFNKLPDAAQKTNVYQSSLQRLNHLPAVKNQPVRPLKLHAPYVLRLVNVHFTYPQTQQEVLHGLNLTIKPGEKLAILGRSGAGKSTLAALLRGDRRPNKGQVQLNGIPTSQFGDQMAHYFSVISQKPYLFNTTIANNLRLGDEKATKAQLWAVLRRVGLVQTVERLPQELETKVAEAGLRFSGGERHRLALARILLKKTPLVLLDEPTVGLDPITEQAVIDTFLTQLHDKTLIWITHHLQGIEQMDQVVFIEDGRITMQGSPQFLWRTQARFCQLKREDEGR